MPKMKIAVVPKPGADFEVQETRNSAARRGSSPRPRASPRHLLGRPPGQRWSLARPNYPRSPGHEIAGVIAELGPGVTWSKQGQHVGVGWHGGEDNTCLIAA
jgi:hypothetical protein